MMAVIGKIVLDVDGLYADMDRQRAEYGMPWKDVARAVGVLPSTFSRMGHGKGGPSADGLLRMVFWLRGDGDASAYLMLADGA